MTDQIQNRVIKQGLFEWRKAKWFQPRELKKSTKIQKQKIKSSIVDNGIVAPFFIWEKGGVIRILDGHGRDEILREIELEGVRKVPDRLPGVWIEVKNREEAVKLVLIYNSHYANIQQLALDDFIKDMDINSLLGHISISSVKINLSAAVPHEEEIPEIPKKPRTKPGDLYILGDNRLLCEDSTNPDHVARLMKSKVPILMVTDPPYGVRYNPEWREGVDLNVGKRSKGKVTNDDRLNWTEAYKLFPGTIAYVWHAPTFGNAITADLETCGFAIISQIVWKKQHFVVSRGDYHWQHEGCLYAVRNGQKHNWQGRRDQSTVWEIANNNSFGNTTGKEETFGHGTQKPVECMLRPILNNSRKGDLIYDPFCGTGTTIVAAEQSGRTCMAIEIDPGYCDVIVARWENLTGKKARIEK